MTLRTDGSDPLFSPRTRYKPWLAGALTLLLGAAIAAQAATPAKTRPKAPPATPLVSYNHDILPILAENCFACHGSDSAARKAGLRLDKFATATAKIDDGTAIVPGNPAASLVFQRISRPDKDDLRMPPADGHKSLTAAQKQLIRTWIAQGAKYEPHWSYIVPKRPPLPAVKNAAWARNPIDRFILAKLDENKLTPAPEADRRTLARRLSLDLTGLPPTPEEVEAFAADKSPNAYEALVDKYLASPHYGEHRARYWLDAARYADTNGIHFDNYREIWSYRDYVINAFNDNKHFDDFTREQLAGDLLPHPTLDQRIATGFTRCNITTNEGGSIDDEVAVMYTRDRTETASQVFLGTTTGCAVCHDHKFDPVSQKEFYSLSAFFNNTMQRAMDDNVKDTFPTIPVPLKEDRARFAQIETDLPGARTLVADRRAAAKPDFTAWLASSAGADAPSAIAASVPTKDLIFHAPLDEGQGKTVTATLAGLRQTFTSSADPVWETGNVADKGYQKHAGGVVQVPGIGDFENTQGWSAAAWVKLPMGGGNGAVLARMDNAHDYRGWDMWLQNDHLAMHIINKWPMDAVKVVSQGSLKRGVWQHICVAYDGGMKPTSIHLYINGIPQQTDVEADALKSTIRTTVPLSIGQRNSGEGVADGTDIQDVRIYGRTLTTDEVANLDHGTRIAYLLSKRTASGGVAALAGADQDELYDWWLGTSDVSYRDLRAKLTGLETERAQIVQRGTVAHIAQEKPTPAIAYVLNRGEYDQRREKVIADVPEFLPAIPAGVKHDRLALANEILSPANPLTARVTVNRFWQEIFGTGIVRTPGDFGVMGDMPVNQPLLDYLAVDFRESGWDVKRFFKQIVMSATYRQSAVITPEKRRKDPANLLLSRGPRFRMDAEMLRDYALASSGILSPKIGGPSVKTYQPDGVWEAVAISGSNTRFYKADMGESLYRRSVYTFWKRSAPPPSLEIFNAPSREVCTVRRERTNTPLQALATLDDPQYVEAARYLAQRTLRTEGTTDARIDFLGEQLLLRPLRPEEKAVVAKSFDDLSDYYKANPKDATALLTVGESKPDTAFQPASLAAWTMVTNELMNLDEVLNK